MWPVVVVVFALWYHALKCATLYDVNCFWHTHSQKCFFHKHTNNIFGFLTWLCFSTFFLLFVFSLTWALSPLWDCYLFLVWLYCEWLKYSLSKYVALSYNAPKNIFLLYEISFLHFQLNKAFKNEINIYF